MKKLLMITALVLFTCSAFAQNVDLRRKIEVTGTAEKEEVIAAVKEGVYDFLLKPIEPHLLLKVTERALRAGQASL